MVGSITGLVHYNNSITDCSAENIVLTKTRVDGLPAIGAISGNWVSKTNGAAYQTTITGNKVTNITMNGTCAIAEKYSTCDFSDIYGANYSGDTAKISGTVENNVVENIVNNVVSYTPATSVEELYAAIGNSDVKEILLSSDLTVNAKDAANPSHNPYGVGGVQVQEGGLLDGNGNTLTVTGANGTWDCGIYASSGTIQNITVNGSFRGIFNGGLTGNLTLNNVVIDKVCYTFHIDGKEADEYTVTFNNCTLNGWTSYSNVAKVFNFNNCNFGQGTGGYKYAFCRPYNDSVFTGCVFSVGYGFDASKTGEVTFVNCYVGNTLITQENVAELLGSGASSIIVSNK